MMRNATELVDSSDNEDEDVDGVIPCTQEDFKLTQSYFQHKATAKVAAANSSNNNSSSSNNNNNINNKLRNVDVEENGCDNSNVNNNNRSNDGKDEELPPSQSTEDVCLQTYL